MSSSSWVEESLSTSEMIIVCLTYIRSRLLDICFQNDFAGSVPKISHNLIIGIFDLNFFVSP